MEGRTIARPNTPLTVRVPQHGDHGAFNGGPDNCPAKLGPRDVELGYPSDVPSMEGRTIARPNFRGNGAAAGVQMSCPFNGGPDNCPAKPAGTGTIATQLRESAFNGGPDNCPAKHCSLHERACGPRLVDPSMEGRTIARPNRMRHRTGPVAASADLQWRAGQLPGQTQHTNVQAPTPRSVAPSMEGRTIARPNPIVTCERHRGFGFRPSMEGRTIARPNAH